MVFELARPDVIRFILLSTKYHSGNYAPVVRLEGKVDGEWVEILPKTKLLGHSEMKIALPKATGRVSEIRASQYPDGGFTRLGLYADLPDDVKTTFDGLSRVYEEKIPQTVKPLAIKYEATPEEIKKNWATVTGEFNNASLSLGAKLISATDEHYSPASLILSPFAPIHMFDGLENARSRKLDSFEEVVVGLSKSAAIHRVEMDFTYFVNNNPLYVSLDGLRDGKWEPLIAKTFVKPFAGNKKDFVIHNEEAYSQVRLRSYPCGGLNRLKIFST